MKLRNTPESWGAVAKMLHWVGAALILAMLGLGLIMVHARHRLRPKIRSLPAA